MRKRLLITFIAFCMSFVAMVALSIFSIERYTTFTAFSDEVDHSNKVINMLYKTEVYLKDIDRWERGYILTNDTVYLRPINKGIDSLRPALSDLEQLTKDNPVQQNNVTLLKGNITLRIASARQDIDYIDSTHSHEASAYYYEGREYMKAANKKMREMHKVENDLLTERYKQEQVYQKLTTKTLKSLLFIFCFIAAVLFIILIRLMRGRMINQEELQAKVLDLQRSHSELQEIAYVASHDLQEPLRKIQVFSNMLLYQKPGQMDEDCRATLERINGAANQMQLLITDLTSLTNLTKTDEPKTNVNLNRLLKFLLIDIDEKVKEKDAYIDVHNLPDIVGYDTQLKILFRALLDNALKFSRDDEQPVIIISSETLMGEELVSINPNLKHKEFVCISCSDNGIGFDNQYISKIFQIFQRLHTHNSEYEGKGIGLAICQRIMANHEGYIIGYGVPQAGAKFKLFFPKTA